MAALPIVVLLAGVVGCATGLHMTVLPNATKFQEGDEISFTCLHSSLQPNEKIRFIKTDSYGYFPCSNQECFLGENDRLKQQYTSTGRYEMLGEAGDKGFTLEISDLRSVDTGTVGCRVESSRETELHTFFVFRQIQQMYFKQKLENGTFVAIEKGASAYPVVAGRNLDVCCQTNDSNAEPKFIMYISEDQEPAYIVTDAFTPGERTGHHLSKTDAGFNSEHYFQNYTTIGTQKLTMESKYHKRYLYCAAQIDEYAPKKIYIKLNVKFAPEVARCENGTVEEYGASNVRLSCTLYTNPTANVTWRFPWGEAITVTEPSELFNDNYTLVLGEYDEKSSTVETSITLTSADEEIFNQPFELTAYNSYGELNTEVYVVLGGGTNAVFASCLLIVTSLLMSVLT